MNDYPADILPRFRITMKILHSNDGTETVRKNFCFRRLSRIKSNDISGLSIMQAFFPFKEDA